MYFPDRKPTHRTPVVINTAPDLTRSKVVLIIGLIVSIFTCSLLSDSAPLPKYAYVIGAGR